MTTGERSVLDRANCLCWMPRFSIRWYSRLVAPRCAEPEPQARGRSLGGHGPKCSCGLVGAEQGTHTLHQQLCWYVEQNALHLIRSTSRPVLGAPHYYTTRLGAHIPLPTHADTCRLRLVLIWTAGLQTHAWGSTARLADSTTGAIGVGKGPCSHGFWLVSAGQCCKRLKCTC